jgi:AhpD family alkylhydroperoxidase
VSSFEEVFALRPDLYEPYRDFEALFWQRELVDPTVLDLCRLRTAQLLGWAAEARTLATDEQVAQLASWPTASCFTDAQRAALAFGEQFVIDPHGVPGAIRDELDRHDALAQVVALTEWMAITDGFTRFRLLCCDEPDAPTLEPAELAPLDLPDDADPAISQSILAEQPELLVAFLRLYGILWSHGELDHTIKEVARLRNARVTGCGYCRNVRFAVARDEGLTEDRVALIDDGYEGTELTAREKAVIRYTDTFLREPSALGDDQRTALARYFTPAQLVELTVGIALFMGFSKIAVSLGQAPADMPTMIVPTPDWQVA